MLLINPQDSIDRQIVFAIVDPRVTNIFLGKDGITYFPDKAELIRYRMGKQNVISLQELPDKKCKKCYGSGKLGILVKPIDAKKMDILDVLIKHLDEDTPEKIVEDIAKLIEMPPNLTKPLEMLVRIAQSELTDHNLQSVSTKYAKQICDDFKRREQQWCPCFMKAYQKAIEDTRRAIKFGIN